MACGHEDDVGRRDEGERDLAAGEDLIGERADGLTELHREHRALHAAEHRGHLAHHRGGVGPGRDEALRAARPRRASPSCLVMAAPMASPTPTAIGSTSSRHTGIVASTHSARLQARPTRPEWSRSVTASSQRLATSTA